MRELTIDFKKTPIYKLPKVKGDSITIKRIAANSLKNLDDQQFTIKTTYPNGTYNNTTIICQSYIAPHHKRDDPTIYVSFKIPDSEYTTIEAIFPKIESPYTFHYETMEDLLKNVGRQYEGEKIDAKAELKNWENSVKSLFNSVISWVEPYKPSITTSYGEVAVMEELLGKYIIKTLYIYFGEQGVVQLVPRGTFVFGGKGRVDIRTANRLSDSYELLLQSIDGEDKWVVIKNRISESKLEFTQGQLITILQDAIENLYR